MLEDEQAAEENTGGEATNSDRPDAQSQGTKYELRADKIAAIIDENRGIVNNYHYTNPSPIEWAQCMKILFAHKSGPYEKLTSLAADQSEMLTYLAEELQDVTAENEEIASATAEQIDATEMPDDLDEWFYKLGEYERYYVVTVALLQGATATDISLQAKELYHKSGSGTEPAQTAASGGAIPSRSASKLRKQTYTIIRQIGGVARIFWQNTEFGVQVLRFIAEESREWPGNMPGQSFIDMLQKWPEELPGDCSRRATRTLGALLAYQSTNQLWRVANAWANNESERFQRLVALLLSGAYETGRLETENTGSTIITTSVQNLLKQWTERFAQSANIRIACAAARTYSQLGRQAPEIALDGLAQFLQLPQKKIDKAMPHNFISTLASGYVALAWSGHIRLVLDALTLYAERWSHQQYLPTKGYQQYRQQREMVLNVIFEAFFLIAASMLAAKQNELSVRYNPTEFLPEHPTLPDPDGRDILLAGLLSQNETRWPLELSTLLCAAILEKKNKAAFDLLQQWAEIILEQQTNTAEPSSYTAYMNFMVNLGQQLQTWCHELEARGITRKAIDTYKEKLIQWKSKQHDGQYFTGKLAQDVLLRLGQ